MDAPTKLRRRRHGESLPATSSSHPMVSDIRNRSINHQEQRHSIRHRGRPSALQIHSVAHKIARLIIQPKTPASTELQSTRTLSHRFNQRGPIAPAYPLCTFRRTVQQLSTYNLHLPAETLLPQDHEQARAGFSDARRSPSVKGQRQGQRRCHSC